MPVKFQSDTIIVITPKLAATGLHEFRQQHNLPFHDLRRADVIAFWLASLNVDWEKRSAPV